MIGRRVAHAGCGAMVVAVALCACRAEPPPEDPEVPVVSVDTAPWVVNAVGTIEESSPGSGVYLLQPGDYRARLPADFRRSGVRVVFSGRPQPQPPGRRIVGHPFVLFAIRRERSAWDSFVATLREHLSPARDGDAAGR